MALPVSPDILRSYPITSMFLPGMSPTFGLPVPGFPVFSGPVPVPVKSTVVSSPRLLPFEGSHVPKPTTLPKSPPAGGLEKRTLITGGGGGGGGGGLGSAGSASTGAVTGNLTDRVISFVKDKPVVAAGVGIGAYFLLKWLFSALG